MIENTILSGLLHNESFARRTLPYLKEEYFQDASYNILFKSIYGYVEKYNGLPTKEALRISMGEKQDMNEQQYNTVLGVIESLEYDPKTDEEWLTDKTEKFCQDTAIYNAVRRSILVLDGKDKEIDKGGIPQLLTDALGVSFDSHIGHDFIEDYLDRYDFYHAKESRVAFDLELLNKITKGGVARKSLSIALAGTGVGKSLFMTHCAAANLMAGMNVLYITLEMAEEKIAERIDANLLDFSMEELQNVPKDAYVKRVERVKAKTTGQLIIKEYPTASAGSAHFRHLVNELKMKRNFKPDIIYIDYLNICMSSRLRHGANVNSYTYIKTIAEELRGLAVELNLPVVSATQTTRSGYANSDVGLEDTSESFGLPATADFMIALISTEELEALGQIMVKQLKNRWGDTNYLKRFVLGINRSKMRLYDAEESAQDDIMNDTPAMDKGDVGERLSAENYGSRKKSLKKKFDGFV